MEEKEAEKVAEKIVTQLFTNGFGERAARLVLFDDYEKNLGGWGKGPIFDIIVANLTTPSE